MRTTTTLLVPFILFSTIVTSGCKNGRELPESTRERAAATPAEQDEPARATAHASERAAGDEGTPKNQADEEAPDDESIDAAKLDCARARITSSGGERLSLEAMATEGGGAKLWRSGGEVERIRGVLLFETSRLRFDYVFDEEELLCAEEINSNLHVIAEGSPGWESYWHRQHLIFDGDRVIWSSSDATSNHAEYGRDSNDIRSFAADLLENAESANEESAK